MNEQKTKLFTAVCVVGGQDCQLPILLALAPAAATEAKQYGIAKLEPGCCGQNKCAKCSMDGFICDLSQLTEVDESADAQSAMKTWHDASSLKELADEVCEWIENRAEKAAAVAAKKAAAEEAEEAAAEAAEAVEAAKEGSSR